MQTFKFVLIQYKNNYINKYRRITKWKMFGDETSLLIISFNDVQDDVSIIILFTVFLLSQNVDYALVLFVSNRIIV